MKQPVLKKKVLPQLIAIVVGTSAMSPVWAAEAENAQSNSNDAVQAVEVRGIRDTLKKNLAGKRDAQSIVDTVNAEDLGKFPDKNVADSLQRVPGISVSRIWGEGRDIFVRGTDKNLNMTQLNGQSVASAYWWKNDSQSRGFNYDILPSEIVGSLEVYKSPSADLDEGSVGGLVIVRTRKPLQLKEKFTAQASVEATYSALPKKTDPQISGMISWKNDDSTLGVLVGLSKQKRTMRRDGLENFADSTKYNIVDQNNVTTPNAYAAWGGGTAIFRQDRDRTTGNIAVQIKPNRDSEVTLNYINSDMKMDNNNQNYLWLAGGLAEGGVIKVNNPQFVTTSDGTKALVAGTFGPKNAVAFEPIYRESYVKSKVLDLDGSLEGDGWKLHAQVGTTTAAGGSTHDRNFWFTGDSRVTVNTASDVYNVKYLDFSPLDASKLTLQGARDWIRRMEGKENYAQADLTWDLTGSMFKNIKVGLKYRDNNVENHRVIGVANTKSPNWIPYSLADLSTGASPLLNQAAAGPGSLTQYAWVADSLTSKAFAMYDKTMVYSEALGEFYKINEKITAAYVKSDFAQGPWRGDVGVRLVRTQQTSEALQDLKGNQTYTPVTISRTYNDVLPSLNVAYDLRKDLIFRAALSRVMARNTYSDLSASTEVSGTTNAATAGNPLLDPYHATQAEFGAEWYFADAALLSATVFAKQLDTFVYTTSAIENVSGVQRNVTRPHNADNGATINGLEVQWQQNYSHGFGSVLNYTFTDAKSGSVSGGTKLNVVGNSKHQLNASAYWEQRGMSVRLSYNYRSKAWGNLNEGGQEVTSAYGQWDASASYDINPKLTVFANAVNLTNAVIRTNTTDGIPVGVYENGARYSVGLRAKF